MINTSITKPRRVALFVGVDEYEDSAIHPLAGAVEDARALHEFFDTRKNQFDTVELLENPTSDAIIDKMDELYKGLSAGDFLLFFFAGHGMVVKDSQQLVCRNSRLRGNRLQNSFDPESFRENPESIILDACRTPIERNRGASSSESRLADKRDIGFYQKFVASHNCGGGSMNVLCSCDVGKTAGEFSRNGVSHGLFTQGLLNVLKEAEKNRQGRFFNQDFANEIGSAMCKLAGTDENVSQRPWISASGTPPLFFLPGMDMKPLKALLESLSKGDYLSEDVYGECLKALVGKSEKPGAEGIFETIRFFANWEEERQRENFGKETASTIIKALCANSFEAGIPAYASQTPDAKAMTGDAATTSRPLRADERRRLRKLAGCVAGRWREMEPSRSIVERLASIQTDSEALEAIGGLENTIRRNFECEYGDGRALGRLEAFFSYDAANVFRELRGLSCPSDVDEALRSLFSAAKVYTAVMGY